MLRIRRIYDDIVPVNREVLRQVKDILQSRFRDVPAEEIELIGEKLSNPFKHRFHCILFVAENMRRRVLGFAILLHEPQIGFCFLDWIASSKKGMAGGGIGSALYDRVRHNRNRPLLQTADPKATITEMLDVREPLYLESAHDQVDSTHLTAEETAFGKQQNRRR